MTAVQQYWIVENDAMLVSSLTPVPVADEDGIKGTVGIDQFLFDDTPIDGWVGAPTLSSVSIITITLPEYDNPYDTADKWKGRPAAITGVTIQAAQQSYSNLYDTADKWKGRPAAITGFTITTVVVTYSNLYDTSDKWKGRPAAITGVTIT